MKELTRDEAVKLLTNAPARFPEAWADHYRHLAECPVCDWSDLCEIGQALWMIATAREAELRAAFSPNQTRTMIE